jgi:hypothetical protein
MNIVLFIMREKEEEGWMHRASRGFFKAQNGEEKMMRERQQEPKPHRRRPNAMMNIKGILPGTLKAPADGATSDFCGAVWYGAIRCGANLSEKFRTRRIKLKKRKKPTVEVLSSPLECQGEIAISMGLLVLKPFPTIVKNRVYFGVPRPQNRPYLSYYRWEIVLNTP